MIKMNKKGSHVGVILSFVIFITFIVFLYTVVRPIVTLGENKQTTLEYIEDKIMKNTSAELTTVSIQIDNSKNPSGQSCIKLEDFFILSGASFNIKVKNETNSLQEAYASPPHLMIVRKVGANTFFKAYSSPEFEKIENKTISPCFSMAYNTYYTFGSITTTKYVFEKEIYKLIEYYKTDYEKLKNELNIPPGNEFGFVFVQSNGTKIEVGNASKSVSVYAGEVPVQYVDDIANIHSGFINVRVW